MSNSVNNSEQMDSCPIDNIVADTTYEGQKPVDQYRSQRKVTSYRLRKGAISPTAQRNFDFHWQQYGVTFTHDPLDELPNWLTQWLASDTPMVLDIGPGTGISAIEMARVEKDINILAAEVYLPGLVKMADAIAKFGLANLRLCKGNAIDIVRECIPSAKLRGIRIFFPDPWPKKRHHKRRLLIKEHLELLLEKLSPSGIIHIATDHSEYADFIVAQIEQISTIRSIPRPGESPISLDRPVTKFEFRAIAAGRTISEIYLQHSTPHYD